MTISTEVLDELLKGVERSEDLLGDAGLMKELKIKLMERMLGAELAAHLGYEEGENAPPGESNRRNGTSAKVKKGQDGELPVAIARDRDSSFEPELVKKGQTRIPEAITAAFPDAMVQTCIVHLVRHSLNFCSWKDRKVVAADLRRTYSAPSANIAEAELDAFDEKWAGKHASIAPAWRRAWQEVIPFFGFDPAIRKII